MPFNFRSFNLDSIRDRAQNFLGLPEWVTNANHRPETLGVEGLEGVGRRRSHYGMAGHKWRELEQLGAGLPWDVKFGLLTAQDVADAKGDLQQLQEQKLLQSEYVKVQASMQDILEEINKSQAELARITMNGRLNSAQMDAKTAEAFYQHTAKIAILQQQNTNAQAYASVQKDLGIQLANARNAHGVQLLRDEHGQEIAYGTAQYATRRNSIVDRYRQKMNQLSAPSARTEREEIHPTANRVIGNGRWGRAQRAS